MKLSILISIFFLLSTHPLSMILLLIAMTFMVAFFMYLTMKTTWFSLILILLILGGMLVLFIYVTSLTPSKNLSSKNDSFSFYSLFFSENKNNPHCFYLSSLVQLSFNKNNIFQYNLNDNTIFLIFITIYLLLTLIAIMKLINSSMAPLRLSN
nr:NADH dehydrogenase subunit 6 [Proknekalia peringueyi]QLD97021.1 NADH dehydrogenase subunit 6 [Proknekalia peringueyi]